MQRKARNPDAERTSKGITPNLAGSPTRRRTREATRDSLPSHQLSLRLDGPPLEAGDEKVDTIPAAKPNAPDPMDEPRNQKAEPSQELSSNAKNDAWSRNLSRSSRRTQQVAEGHTDHRFTANALLELFDVLRSLRTRAPRDESPPDPPILQREPLPGEGRAAEPARHSPGRDPAGQPDPPVDQAGGRLDPRALGAEADDRPPAGNPGG